MTILNQSDVVPLYKQLKDIIKNSILTGEMKPNQKLLSETDLSEKYGVSRITVRNAINELVKEGLLIKKQGKGTFISSHKLERNIVQVLSFTDLCKLNRVSPGSKIIGKQIQDASDADIEILGLKQGDRVISIHRIRYADNIPVSLEQVYFPENYSFLLMEDLENSSLYDLLQNKYKIELINSRKTIEISLATDKEARLLNIPKKYPMLLVNGFVADSKGVPVHRTTQLIVGDKFKFIV